MAKASTVAPKGVSVGQKRIEMLTNRILVKPQEAVTTTKGGIALPDVAVERPLSGVVVAVGPEVPTAKPGHVIFYTRYAGSEIRYDEEDFRVMTEAEALFVEIEGG